MRHQQGYLKVFFLCGFLGLIFIVAGVRMKEGGAPRADATACLVLGAICTVIAGVALRRHLMA